MLFEEWRATKIQVGLATFCGKGHAGSGQHFAAALANERCRKTHQKKKNEIREDIFISKEYPGRVSGVVITPARHTWPCGSGEVLGVAD